MNVVNLFNRCSDCPVFERDYGYPYPLHCVGDQRTKLNDEMNARLRLAGIDPHQLEKAFSRPRD